MFIHPMWDNEAERRGKQKCTPIGYTLHVAADLIGFIGLLLLLACIAFLAWRWINGAFRVALLWTLIPPLVLGIAGKMLFHYSWWLAYRKGFRYDSFCREATWMESGECRKYTNPPYCGSANDQVTTTKTPELDDQSAHE